MIRPCSSRINKFFQFFFINKQNSKKNKDYSIPFLHKLAAKTVFSGVIYFLNFISLQICLYIFFLYFSLKIFYPQATLKTHIANKMPSKNIIELFVHELEKNGKLLSFWQNTTRTILIRR